MQCRKKVRSKHIERKHYFIRECVEEGRIRVPFVPSTDNLADFFTKPLMGKEYFRMRERVMNIPHDSAGSADGGVLKSAQSARDL